MFFFFFFNINLLYSEIYGATLGSDFDEIALIFAHL